LNQLRIENKKYSMKNNYYFINSNYRTIYKMRCLVFSKTIYNNKEKLVNIGLRLRSMLLLEVLGSNLSDVNLGGLI